MSPLELKTSLRAATYTRKVTMPTTASLSNKDERKQGRG